MPNGECVEVNKLDSTRTQLCVSDQGEGIEDDYE